MLNGTSDLTVMASFLYFFPQSLGFAHLSLQSEILLPVFSFYVVVKSFSPSLMTVCLGI